MQSEFGKDIKKNHKTTRTRKHIQKTTGDIFYEPLLTSLSSKMLKQLIKIHMTKVT